MTQTTITPNPVQHGLASLEDFQAFCLQNNLAETIRTNFQAQFEPSTPTGRALLQDLVSSQLRFLYMEHLFGLAMTSRKSDPLQPFDASLRAIFRELDRLPTHIQRVIRLLRRETAPVL